MSLLYFSDILKKAGLDPAKVKLIRHSLSDKNFAKCYYADPQMVWEYTRLQKQGFSKGYDYWCIFISGKGTTARLFACYKVNDSVPDTPELKPAGFPLDDNFKGELAYYDLEPVDCLQEYEHRLVIEWGNAAISWHQKGTTEKSVLAIDSPIKKSFIGYDNVVLPYAQLKEVVQNREVYELWQAALSAVKAIYLIVDTKNGKQYVGSAYGKDGLLGRWRVYVDTLHGNNKLMKEVVCAYPDRYQYFQFSILQIFSKTAPDKEIIDAESLWKKKLGTIPFGMNDN